MLRTTGSSELPPLPYLENKYLNPLEVAPNSADFYITCYFINTVYSKLKSQNGFPEYSYPGDFVP